MHIDKVLHDEYSDEQIAAMLDDNKRVARLYKGGGLDEWLHYSVPLFKHRATAMRAARTNDPRNRYCQECLRVILRETYPDFLEKDGMLKPEVGHLIFLGDPANRQVLDEYRATLSEAKLINLATPKAARLAVDRILRTRAKEEELRQLGVQPDDNTISEQLQADRDEEPTATDRQLTAAFRKKFVGQMAELFIEADHARARDLAEHIIEHSRRLKRELKEQVRREKAERGE